MLKIRKENKGDTVTMILLTKYIIRRTVPTNQVKKNSCIEKFLLYYCLM